MTRIRAAYRYLTGVAVLLLAAGCGGESPHEQVRPAAATVDSRPNVLLIVADDLGFTDLGAFGSEIATPVLDDLALDGLRITNLHAGPACQQTRAMLMASTGYVRAIHTRPRFEQGGERNNLLSLDWATIPELLQDAGYSTFMAGKWDLGWDDGYTPSTRGFDRSYALLGGASSFFAELLMTPFSLGISDDGVRLELDDLTDDFYITDTYTDKMLEYLQGADEEKPWFAYLPYTAPHWPLQLPDDWLDKYAGQYDIGYDELRVRRFERANELDVIPENGTLERFTPQTEPWENLSDEEKRKYARAQEIYAGMVEHLDMSIGRVVEFLEESGQLDDTVIVFMSDHGASAGEHGVGTGRVPRGGGPQLPETIDNRFENFGRIGSFIDHGRGFGEAATAPFRYTKGSLNEGGLRAAAFVRYPAAINGGGVTHEFMTMMDILPTFMDIAGTEHPGETVFAGRPINDILGRSAWPHLTGATGSVHDDDYAVGWSGQRGSGALIRGDFKIINAPAPGQRETTDWRLYNLVDDPGEHDDIAAEYPEIVGEMVEIWESDWRP